MRASLATAAKGRMSTLSKGALRQQETSDHFTQVVNQRCAPVFEALADLSRCLRDDCANTFPVMFQALEELSNSASEVSRMLEALNATKASREAENANLRRQASELRGVLAERTLEIKQVIT